MEDKRTKKMQIKNKFNKNKWDGSSLFLIVFAVLFIAMIFRSFIGGTSPKMLINGEMVSQPKTIEMSFSDVLRRAPEIQTMKIRGDEANGVLRDGTEYTATIKYDPELLSKISEMVHQ